MFLFGVNLPVIVHKGFLALSFEALKYDLKYDRDGRSGTTVSSPGYEAKTQQNGLTQLVMQASENESSQP